MTFWIYNVGLGVPISEKRLSVEPKPLPLQELAKTARLHATDKGGHNRPVDEPLYSSALPPVKAGAGYRQTKTESRHQVFYADQIMSSPVITLSLNMPFESAWRLFIEKRFRHFPVINQEERLLGIVSDRDMLTEAASFELTSSPPKKRKTIAQLMHAHVLTASAKTNIREICRVMFGQHVGALPITDDKGRILGIITRSDILRTMIENEPIELWV